MARTRLAGSVATAALIVAVGAACSNETPEPTPSPSPTTQTTAPAPTTSPPTTAPTTSTPPSDTEVAADAAADALRKFYDVRTQLRQDPSAPLSLLDDVATSTELSAQLNLFDRERQQGLRQTGETRIVELEVKSVNLDNSDPSTGKVPTVQIELCFDVSGVDVIDQDGNSAVSPDRPDTGWIQFLVANYEWDTDPDGAWRVASSRDIERTPCVPS